MGGRYYDSHAADVIFLFGYECAEHANNVVSTELSYAKNQKNIIGLQSDMLLEYTT